MRTTPRIAQALFTSELRSQLLGLVLLNHERKFYVRELARKLSASHGTLHRELKSLCNAGILLREQDGNRVNYQANTEASIYPELSGLLRKTVGLVDVIAKALGEIDDDIAEAFIYGSEAKGDAVAGSDIDLMVVGNIDELKIHSALRQAEEKLERPINYTLFSVKEYARKASEKKSFVSQVLAGDTISIIGALNEAQETD
jgi:predicted nucleotidyltransferase